MTVLKANVINYDMQVDAMANALEEIRRAAKHIAPANDEDGVMRVVKERFGL